MERRYEIDWLRILLIASVFLFHIGMFFNPWSWHLKNDKHYEGLVPLMSFLHTWRMPLLFFVSGAGTFLALGQKSIREYVRERRKRLLFPFLVGIFTLVPVQVYLERFDQYDSLWDLYLHMFDGIYPTGNFSWHHLWFILYLFVISMMAIPLLRWFRSPSAVKGLAFIEKWAKKRGGLSILLLPILLTQVFLRQYWPNSTNALLNDWAYLFFDFTYFIYGYLFTGSKIISKCIVSDRYLNLLVTSLLCLIYFFTWRLFEQHAVDPYLHFLMEMFMVWFTSLTVLGFFYRHMCFDLPIRKHLNQMIYPFYLLHQPIILLVAFYLQRVVCNDGVKVFILIVFSFIITCGIYFLFIKPFNVMRVAFGLKIN